MTKVFILPFLLCGMLSLSATPTLNELLKRNQVDTGFFDLIKDTKEGKVYLKVQQLNQEFIYQSSLAQGLGSNDIGLDRGQLSATRLVFLQAVGDKVLMVEKNTRFRAISTNTDEQQAVEQAFANSVVWSFPLIDKDENTWLLDATAFLSNDIHGVANKIKQRQQGNFSLEKSRSVPYFARCKSFPDNTELEAIITFTGNDAGRFVKQAVIDDKTFSLKLHHSFIRLPKPGFKPRPFLPNSGYFQFSYADYAQPINKAITQRYIYRHRLEKKYPDKERSVAVKPIVYYLDPGTPEPVRSALLDGARWWNQAFDALGYIDAFQVTILPDDIDPMDSRYNTIQWVHRATRGWSYGSLVPDPRTGEIIKGHVTLGSLRVRQDYLIAQGLMGDFSEYSDDSALQALALARIRQLSAHEVGHTLGLAHNFAASSYGRASVMDYPHPYYEFDGKTITADDAYAVGMGAWDLATIAYGYGDLKSGDQTAQLQALVNKQQQRGLIYLSDPDARDPSSVHPLANLWDNGADPIAELNRVIRIRKHALTDFGIQNLKQGQALSDLEELLVPVYYFHRYQATAAAKSIGGYYYRYDTKGNTINKVTPVKAKSQLNALKSLVSTLQPEFLSIREPLKQLLAPKAYGYSRTRESVNGSVGQSFDAVHLAGAAAQHTFSLLFAPKRLLRLVQQHADDTNIPNLDKIGALIHRQVVSGTYAKALQPIHQKVIDLLYSNYLNLLADKTVSPLVKSEVLARLTMEKSYLENQLKKLDDDSGYFGFFSYQLRRINKPTMNTNQLVQLPSMPPGSPI